MLCLRIESRRRLVEHEQKRAIAHEPARQRQFLPLPERHFDSGRPRWSQLRIKPRGHTRDVVTSARAIDRCDDSWFFVDARDIAEAHGWNSNRKKSWNAPASRSRQSVADIRASGWPSTR